MADTLTINGTAVNLIATNTTLDSLIPFVKGGVPELHFSRMLQKLAALPDTWSGQPVTLTMQATSSVVFSGDVVGYVDRWMDRIGWVREYRAQGLVHRADFIPVTDAITLTDTSVWNLTSDNPNFVASRAGQTVGQIVQQILQMATNGAPLVAAGIGNYSISGGIYTLPSITLTDLSGLTVIPPWQVTISGERILLGLENFVQSCHPNHFLHVDPAGNIRILDSRTFTPTTLTIGADPRLQMPTLTRDYSDSYSRVEVRGNTQVQATLVQTLPLPGSSASDCGLAEDFAWGSYTNAEAKAAWTPSDWSQPNSGIGPPLASGACTCPDTQHVTISTTLTFAANALAQGSGELLGQLLLFADSLGGNLQQIFQARILSNTATSGGSCTCQIDTTMPSTSYNSYQLFGLAVGENVVGRRYRVTNAAIAAAMQNYFPYPVAYTFAFGTGATLTSTPMGLVMFNPFGGTSQPWNLTSAGITLDPVNGYVYFSPPTQVAAYGLATPVQWAANVQAFLPIAVGTLVEYAPSSTTWAGTLYTVEGIERTKIITVLEWRDYSNDTNMAIFASEFLDSVKDVVVEGTVPYVGLLTAYLAPGNAVSIAGAQSSGGASYPTGWEALALPVVSVEVAFQSGDSGTSYATVLHLSNRRGRYSSENYLRPRITGAQFGGGDGAFTAGGPTYGAFIPWGGGQGTTAGEAQAAEGRRQQAEFQKRMQDDPAFRQQVQAQQAQQAAMNPWDVAAQGLNAMDAANRQGPQQQAAQGLNDLFNQANVGLGDLGIDLGLNGGGAAPK
jgi:hypothetical protein